MNTKDLRVLLEGLIGKFRRFKDIDSLKDQRRLKLLNTDKEMSLSAKSNIIKGIIDNEIKFRLFEDFEFMSALDKAEIVNIILSFNDFYKMKILQEQDILERYDISNSYRILIIESLEDKNKQKILFNREYLEKKLGIESCEISGIVASIEDIELKKHFIEYYKFNEYSIGNILKTFPDQSKINIEYELSEYIIQNVLASLNVDSLINFFNNNMDFLIQKRISPYQITSKLEKEKILNLISKFESISLSVNDKKKILATLDNNIKKDIDKSKFPKEYIKAIKQELNERVLGSLIPFSLKVDLNGDLESYIGLDELLYINGMNIYNEDKPKLFKLAEICPSISIYDDLGLGSSTIEEYKSAENWIETVLEGINPNWTDIQKLAYIDNAIGKKISYSPDFNTEVFDHDKARPLWKIIASGYGVCNGIAQVEKYMLNKIGIETEIVYTRRHAFLKVKNIEIITANGKIIKGDTILDPTWNLNAHKYGGRPQNFCRSYNEIRKHDNRKGKDTECHKNDKKGASATLDLDEKSVRMIFSSIGIADKEGNFPIKKFVEKSKTIDDYNLPAEDSIKKQFKLLEEYLPDFAKCQNSTTVLLENVLLNQKNLKFNRCVINRVYERSDKDKRPVLYVYIDLQDIGKKFYFADKNKQAFIELTQKEFEEKFECYEMDMELYDGYKPWEYVKVVNNIEDLSKSSGEIGDLKGGER